MTEERRKEPEGDVASEEEPAQRGVESLDPGLAVGKISKGDQIISKVAASLPPFIVDSRLLQTPEIPAQGWLHTFAEDAAPFFVYTMGAQYLPMARKRAGLFYGLPVSMKQPKILAIASPEHQLLMLKDSQGIVAHCVLLLRHLLADSRLPNPLTTRDAILHKLRHATDDIQFLAKESACATADGLNKARKDKHALNDLCKSAMATVRTIAIRLVAAHVMAVWEAAVAVYCQNGVVASEAEREEWTTVHPSDVCERPLLVLMSACGDRCEALEDMAKYCLDDVTECMASLDPDFPGFAEYCNRNGISRKAIKKLRIPPEEFPSRLHCLTYLVLMSEFIRGTIPISHPPTIPEPTVQPGSNSPRVVKIKRDEDDINYATHAWAMIRDMHKHKDEPEWDYVTWAKSMTSCGKTAQS